MLVHVVLQVDAIRQMDVVPKVMVDVPVHILKDPISNSPCHRQIIDASGPKSCSATKKQTLRFSIQEFHRTPTNLGKYGIKRSYKKLHLNFTLRPSSLL